ncbi:MAG: TetR/AcrR family transcriptional regulator [Acidobacteriota bacterium]
MRTVKGPRRTARQAILDAAAGALADSPNESMAVIAEAAGVGRATLYRHFPSREALLSELSLEAIRLMDEATVPILENASSAEEAFRRMLEAWLPFGDRFHFLATIPVSDLGPDVAVESQRQLDDLAAFVDHAKGEGLFARNVSTAWIVATIDALIWTAWSSVHRGELALRDAAPMVFRTLVEGLRRDDASETS